MEHFKVVAKGRLGGVVETRNIFYLECSVNPTTPELITDIPAWLTGFYTPIVAFLSNTFSLYGWDVHQWDIMTASWLFRVSGAMTFVGTLSGDALPSQIAAVMVAYTGLKRTFSRKFIAGFIDTEFTGNLMLGSALVAMTSSLAFWMATFTAPSMKIYVPGLWTKGLIFAPFIQGVVDQIAGTMRRRKQNVGI